MKSFNDYLKEAALSAKQKKIAAVAGDKDKIDAADLATLRNGKKPVEEASCSSNMKKEELVGKQHKLDKNKNGKLDAHDFKLLRKEEVEELDEGKMKDIHMSMMDLATRKDYSSHKQFTSADYDAVGKKHGISGKELAIIAGHKTAQQADTHFKKPVEPGKGMDRAKALAQRGMQSLSKEEVERIEEKLTQIDELSKDTLASYVGKAAKNVKTKTLLRKDFEYNANSKSSKNPEIDRKIAGEFKDEAEKRLGNINKAATKLAKEEVEQIDELSKNTLGSYVKRSANQAIIKSLANPKDDSDDMKTIAKREKGINLATSKLAKEEVSAEMSPYLKATLKVMDEGKIDNLRDAQKLRQDTQSAYDKNYKPDTSHPHIQVVKGNAYGGANQKDDEGDEKPDETKEKKGRGRPTGSKSGARQKGGGHEDGGIPVHNLNLPKSYK
jgi:hypothetical protein